MRTFRHKSDRYACILGSLGSVACDLESDSLAKIEISAQVLIGVINFFFNKNVRVLYSCTS